MGSQFRVASLPDVDAPEKGARAAGRQPDEQRQASGAIEELYREEAPRLSRAMRRRSSATEDSLDFVHDAFVRLLSLGTARILTLEQERPAAYLTRTARNLIIDRRKRDHHRAASAHVSADDVVLRGPDPVAQTEARDELRRIEEALLQVRPRARAIYIAHRVEGLSYAEIATRCGISVKGVEKHMAYAIATLDQLLDRA